LGEPLARLVGDLELVYGQQGVVGPEVADAAGETHSPLGGCNAAFCRSLT
jgi:hypothetical protein